MCLTLAGFIFKQVKMIFKALSEETTNVQYCWLLSYDFFHHLHIKVKKKNQHTIYFNVGHSIFMLVITLW